MMLKMSLKEFMDRDYEEWCVDGSEDYRWLDIIVLIVFGVWIGGKLV